MLGVSFLFFSGNLFPHFSLTMLQLSVLTPSCIHPPGIYFSCLNIFSIFLDFLPSLSQHFLNSPRNFTMTIFTFFTCANDSFLTCIHVYLGLVFNQIIVSQIVLILLFPCLLGLYASNLWCCICALKDFYICSLADFCICRLALFHFPKHLFSVGTGNCGRFM